MGNTLKFLTFVLTFLSLSHAAFSTPLTEKTPATETVPVEALSTGPDRVRIATHGSFKDIYLFAITGSTLKIVDLTTWALHSTQPDDFPSSITDVALLPNGTSLIISLSSGNIARIELDDEDTFVADQDGDSSSSDDDSDTDDQDDSDDDRVTIISDRMTDPDIDHMVADDVDNLIYMINDKGYYFEYNFDTQNLLESAVLVTDTSTDDTSDTESESSEDTTTESLTGIAFSGSNTNDKVLLITNLGNVLRASPSTGSFLQNIISTGAVSGQPSFLDSAVFSSGDYLALVDDTNDVVWIYDIKDNQYHNQLTGGSSPEPIEIDADDNDTLETITVFSDGTTTSAYVSGTKGVSVLDVSDPETATESSKVIDANSSSSSSGDPITLSATPTLMLSSSTTDGHVYSVNGDASISVISDRPFVSISSISSSSVTESSSTFNITFQADAAGTYTVVSGGLPTDSGGTEIISSTTLESADTSTTTATVDINDYNRSVFNEGNNRIYVFVTDSSNNKGRSAVMLNVDRPPESLTITGVSFGSQKAYIEFTPSSDTDIASYSLFAEPAENQSSPSCPGSLTFSSGDAVSSSLSPSSCSSSSCTGTVTGLTNGTYYCTAARAVDEAGQNGTLSSFSTAIFPEQTVGPAGLSGETGCSLNPKNQTNSNVLFYALFLTLVFFVSRKLSSKTTAVKTILVITFLLGHQIAQARILDGERTPQNWTLEPKLSMWIPTDSTSKNFFGSCCQFSGEVEFGYLFNNQLNVTITGGFGYESGSALGSSTGSSSADTFNLMLFPLRLDFVYRFDYKTNQFFLPYARIGADSVFFREKTGGNTIQGVKFGAHAGAGVGFLLDRIESLNSTIESDMGINDVYLIIEGRYAFINNFQSSGLDLSGFYPYMGVLFEF